MIPEFNCEKVSYKGRAVQYDSTNQHIITEMLRPYASVSPYGNDRLAPECLIVRFHKHQPDRSDITTLYQGHYVVQGENGWVKCYTEGEFLTKYRALT